MKEFRDTESVPVVVAYSIGDVNGIGPEVLLKALSTLTIDNEIHIIYGNGREFEDSSLEKYSLESQGIRIVDNRADIFEDSKPGKYLLRCIPDELMLIQHGKLSSAAGRVSMQSFEEALKDTVAGRTDAIVTAPISKEAIHLAGWAHPGHTEMLGEACGIDHPLMMMVHQNLRVALHTVHIPLSDVPKHILKREIVGSLNRFSTALRSLFGIEHPRIAVLGLNPHAGDGGVIGREEIDEIRPAIELYNREWFEGGTLGGAVSEVAGEPMAAGGAVGELAITAGGATGPFPADGFFARRSWQDVDGVLAMYHDQGLVPFKTIAGGGGVNLTGGLPIIRTSPDHGTGFDIAGKDLASPSSMLEAISLAVQLARRRKVGSISSLHGPDGGLK